MWLTPAITENAGDLAAEDTLKIADAVLVSSALVRRSEASVFAV